MHTSLPDELDFQHSDTAFVHYIDDKNRAVKGFCTILSRHDIDGEPCFLITAKDDVINGVGQLSPHIPNLAIVSIDELEPSYRCLDVVVDNTIPRKRKNK